MSIGLCRLSFPTCTVYRRRGIKLEPTTFVISLDCLNDRLRDKKIFPSGGSAFCLSKLQAEPDTPWSYPALACASVLHISATFRSHRRLMMESLLQEGKPFLEDDDVSSGAQSRTTPVSYKRPSCRSSAFILAGLLLLSNSVWLSTYLSATTDGCIRPKLIYCITPSIDPSLKHYANIFQAPALEYISYQRVELDRSIQPDNVYAGDPRPKHDQAWRDIVKRM